MSETICYTCAHSLAEHSFGSVTPAQMGAPVNPNESQGGVCNPKDGEPCMCKRYEPFKIETP